MLRLLVGALHLALTVFVSLFDSQFSTHPTYTTKPSRLRLARDQMLHRKRAGGWSRCLLGQLPNFKLQRSVKRAKTGRSGRRLCELAV
jgi:hypothetical protein